MSSSLVHDPKNNTKEKAVANDNKNFFILVYSIHLKFRYGKSKKLFVMLPSFC